MYKREQSCDDWQWYSKTVKAYLYQWVNVCQYFFDINQIISELSKIAKFWISMSIFYLKNLSHFFIENAILGPTTKVLDMLQ